MAHCGGQHRPQSSSSHDMSSVPVPWPTTTALPASVTGANDCQSDQITTPIFSHFHFHMTSLSCLGVVGLGGGGTHWIMARVELKMARLASDPRTASAVAVIDYPVGVNMCHALLVDTPSHCELEVAMHPWTACTVLCNVTLALHNVARRDLTPISHTPCSHPRPQVMATVRASEGSRVQSSISGPTNSRGVLCQLTCAR
jgi:hypothetical protein